MLKMAQFLPTHSGEDPLVGFCVAMRKHLVWEYVCLITKTTPWRRGEGLLDFPAKVHAAKPRCPLPTEAADGAGTPERGPTDPLGGVGGGQRGEGGPEVRQGGHLVADGGGEEPVEGVGAGGRAGPGGGGCSAANVPRKDFQGIIAIANTLQPQWDRDPTTQNSFWKKRAGTNC